MEICNYEIAKKLKEKGFREKVNAYYGKHENIFDIHPALDMNDADYRASAPTISQVLKWLREEKRLDCGAIWDNSTDKWIYYAIEMDVPDLSGTYISKEDYESWEAAALAGIVYCLDNLIIEE